VTASLCTCEGKLVYCDACIAARELRERQAELATAVARARLDLEAARDERQLRESGDALAHRVLGVVDRLSRGEDSKDAPLRHPPRLTVVKDEP
jgi:hypothetical protein